MIEDNNKFEYVVLEKTKHGNYFVKGVFETPSQARQMEKGLNIINEVSKTDYTYHTFCNVFDIPEEK